MEVLLPPPRPYKFSFADITKYYIIAAMKPQQVVVNNFNYTSSFI
jgi:hypothetical protein